MIQHLVMQTAFRVLIVEDHAMLRLALKEALAGEKYLEWAGEAIDGASALEAYRELKPDVVTLDYRLPDMDGVDIARQIRDEFPGARMVMISIFEGEEDVWRAREAGVQGYLPKSVEISEMLNAIRRVAAGEEYFPADLLGKLKAREAKKTLTDRELQVLRLIVLGHSNKEIVSDLNLSESTVKLHISNMLSKLKVLDRTQAAILAVKAGIVHLDDLSRPR
jgi:DNA-binding NarL/FixJ family response regulator